AQKSQSRARPREASRSPEEGTAKVMQGRGLKLRPSLLKLRGFGLAVVGEISLEAEIRPFAALLPIVDEADPFPHALEATIAARFPKIRPEENVRHDDQVACLRPAHKQRENLFLAGKLGIGLDCEAETSTWVF